MQEKGLIVQVCAFLSTVMAPVGHLIWHTLHNTHASMLFDTCPLVDSLREAGPFGYLSVAGFLKRFFSSVLVKLANVISYLSVQEIQGSMVTTSIGTSATSQPCRVFARAGIFAKVGVLTLILSMNFFPEACT